MTQIIGLGIGSPNDFASEVAMDRFNFEQRQRGGLGYGPLQGLNEAIDALIQWQQEELGAGDLNRSNVCFGGGSRLLLVRSFEALLARGSEVALTERYYNGHVDGLWEAEMKPVIIPGRTFKKFLANLRIRCKLGQIPKAVVICNVSNPTGQVWQREELATLSELSFEYEFFVFEDYAYGPFAFNLGYAPSLISIDKNLVNTVFIGTSSKMYGLAGYGLGFAVASPNRNQLIMQSKKVLAEGSCKPALLALASALKEDRQYIVKARQTYHQRAIFTTAQVRKVGLVQATEPEGGMFGYYPIGAYRGGSTRLVLVMEQRGVELRADDIYGGSGSDIRWCYRVYDDETAIAAGILAGVLAEG